MRRLNLLALALVLAACQDAPEPLAPSAADSPLQSSAETVRGQYIVVFDPGVADAPGLARQLTAAHGGSLQLTYEHALKGFSARLSEAAAAALRRHPSVTLVEADQVVHAFGQTVPTGITRAYATANPSIDIDGSDDIIDTGIDLDHPDLNVNVAKSVTCSGGSPFSGKCTSGGDDDNNHGTHVAGTVAALDNGIGVVGMAPGARVWAVKVLRADGSGYMSWIVAGIDYVTANAAEVEVANMSLGCECSSDAMNKAISNSVAAGVVYVVAAGNSDKDASTFSPANHPDVVTVSALADFDGAPGGSGTPTCRNDQDDTLADFSNWGTSVEIAAPGVCILSTIPGGGYATYSGTSMASPHAAGAAALYASRNNPGSKAQVLAIRDTLVTYGNLNWTDDSGDGRQEPLLDVGSDGTRDAVFAPVMVSGSGSGGGATAPAAPSGLTVTGTTTSSVSLSWTDNATDETGYYVHRSTTSGFTPSSSTRVSGDLGANATSYTDSGLSASTTYYYRVEAYNSAGPSYSSQASATTQAAGSSGGMHVGDLDGSRNIKGGSGKWEAFVTVLVHDDGEAAVPNATVAVSWSSGSLSGTASGTTGSDGRVTLGTGNLTSQASATFTVTGITHGSLVYDGTTPNHDPDGDSDGTSITVWK